MAKVVPPGWHTLPDRKHLYIPAARKIYLTNCLWPDRSGYGPLSPSRLRILTRRNLRGVSRVFTMGGDVCADMYRPVDLPWPPTKALHASSTVTEDLPVDANFLFFLFFCGFSFQ